MKTAVKLIAIVLSLVMLAACSQSGVDISSALSSKSTSKNSSSALSEALSSDQLSSADSSAENQSSDEMSSATSSKKTSSKKNSSAVSSKKTSSKKNSSAVSSKKTSSKKNSSAVSSKTPSNSNVSSATSSLPTTNDDGYEKYSGTRNAWLWPFAATSIWNMPIGSNAQLKPAGFGDEYWIGADTEYMVKTKSTDPVVKVYSPSSWGQRWPGDRPQGEMHVPYNFILADASGNSTPNNCATFLMPDGRTLKQLEPCCRAVAGAQIVGWRYNDVDLFGDGIGGAHYGSGLSAIGGSIRKGELTSDEPIRHALKLNVWGKKYLYYDKSAKIGYVWPADRHDSCAPSGDQAYGGSDPALRMGTLLTIPKNITAESLGLKTEIAKKIFYALQNYGCYIVDNSGWSCYDWSIEDGVDAEVQAKYGYRTYASTTENKSYRDDTLKMIKSLHIVTNNSPTSIGGGGTPCKPLAPDFE